MTRTLREDPLSKKSHEHGVLPKATCIQRQGMTEPMPAFFPEVRHIKLQKGDRGMYVISTFFLLTHTHTHTRTEKFVFQE